LLLAVKDLTKKFGGIKAVDDISFSIEEGSIVGLIGPNGAGKTVTFDLITGYYKSDRGTITFMAERLNDLKIHEITSKGIGRTFQVNTVFPKLSVVENLLLAMQKKGVRSSLLALIRSEKEDEEKALDMLEFVDLIDLKEEFAGNLSYGQQKLLGFICALSVYPGPKLLLLDEPIAGVNLTMANKLVDLIRGMRERGKTFIIIEHNMSIIMDLCDKIIVLDHGRKIAEGEPQQIQSNELVFEAYFGHQSDA